MENIDLFNFKFVDREIEREIIERFLLTPNINKIMWIHGESGVGKTELMRYFMSKFSVYEFIHINPIKSQTTSYMSSFTKELDKQNFSFPKFIIKNFKAIKDLAKESISEINATAKFFTGILDIGEKVFIDKNNNFFSLANVITKYIELLIKKKHYVFVLDNFQQCDDSSIEIIQEITKNLYKKTNINFIFITTDKTILSDSAVIRFLLEKIPSIPTLVGPLEKKEYFMDILLSTYSLEGIDASEMEQLFEVCNGIPEKLKNFLRNMYLSQGIEYYKDSDHARLMPAVFNSILYKGVENTDLESLSIIEKLVFMIVIRWNETLSINLLDRVVRYVAHEVLHLPEELQQQVILGIYKLLDLNILELEECGVRIKHDMIYLSSLPKYNAIPETVLYNKLYEFINNNKQEIINTYSFIFFNINNALYSYKAKIFSWERINLECLKILIDQSDYRNIISIIERLETNLTNFNASDLILLSECFYNNGKYDKARNILNYTQSKLCKDEEFFKYFYLSGKIYNMLLNKHEAEKELLSAQKYVVPFSDEDILVKHMLQLVLVEVPGRKKEAENIFCSVSENLEKYEKNSKVLGTLLKNCSNYYSGDNALRLLEKSIEISRKNNDPIEEAFIKNNMGYEYFKKNDLETCLKLYQESIDILNQTKIHESAYPLSNLAVCCMTECQYDKAITLINRALFWNCSNYLEFVLNTHLMLCFERVGEKDESLQLSKKLVKMLTKNNINDPVILRKVYLNLAINYDKLQLEDDAREYAQKAYKYCINTSSEYRASMIYKKYGGQPQKNCEKIKVPYYIKCYFDHWITIFSHD